MQEDNGEVEQIDQAIDLLGADDFAKARALLTEVIAADRSARVYLVEALVGLGLRDEAEQEAYRALDEDEPGPRLTLGKLLKDKFGDSESAERLYRRAAEAGDPSGHFNLGVTAAERDDLDAAIKHYRDAERAGDEDVWNNLAQALIAAGRPAEAEEVYRRAAFNDSLCGALLELGILFRELDRPQDAEKVLREALEIDPAAHNYLGALLSDTGREDEAETLYRSALDQGVTDVWLNLGNLLSEQDRFDESHYAYEQALANGESDAHNNLALLLEQLGEIEAAERHYTQAIATGDALARRNYGLLLLTQARVEEGRKQIEAAAAAGDARSAALLTNWEYTLAEADRDAH